MKTLAALALGCLLVTGAWAQRGGMRGGGGFRGGSGGFHGGFRGGFSGYRGFHSGFGFNRFGSYGLPYYSYYPSLGFGYDLGYCSSYVWDSNCGYPAYPEYPAVAAAPSYAYAPDPPAPVVINQYTPPPQPVVRVYQPPEPEPGFQPSRTGPTIYLIAFKNHVIVPAYAYWVEGATLRYLDMDHKQQQSALDTVDRDFSAQLNRERRVPFQLP